MTIFFRVLDAADKAAELRFSINNDHNHRRYEIDSASFRDLPGSPFAYWISSRIRAIFGQFDPFERGERIVRQGGVTGNDARFLRLQWEVPSAPSQVNWLWVPFAKGGKLSLWYSDYSIVVLWDDTRKTFGGYTGLLHRPTEKPSSADHYFKAGLTWPLRASRFAPVPLPKGSIFSIRGYAVLAPEEELLSIAAIANSRAFDYLFKVALGRFGFPEFVVGVLQRLPFPEPNREETTELSRLARQAWSLKRILDTVNETSHAFLLPAALRTRLGLFDLPTIEAELVKIQSAIDDLAYHAYELDGNDRASIEAWASKSKGATTSRDPEADAEDGADEDSDEVEDAISENSSATLQSWAVGVAFGRFDLRLAMGERQAPPEPEPFDSLPTRSPGMFPEFDGGQFPARPVLVDDLGHLLDLTAQVGVVLEQVGTPHDEEILHGWLVREFFQMHIKMYSKSRRKAPIYWQLATPSVSYSVWLYIHAFSRDTLYRVQEIASTKLVHDERKLESLRADLGPNPKAAERKALAAQETFVEELHTFLEEVKRVTPLWNPVLDDGVIINFAPLWRLVPHHKPWQKELKDTWDALCAGKYDWAHLAMHLWPERVGPKCATDRSLAIAHGLEEVFWEEDKEGKWKPRSTRTRPMEELVRERTSSAVKVALKGLLEAPLAMANGGSRGRRGRRRKNTGEAV